MPVRSPLDAAAGRPLYEELRARLLDGISRGRWKAGDAIPTEAELAREFTVSIGTVRKAVDALVGPARRRGRRARHAEPLPPRTDRTGSESRPVHWGYSTR